MPKSVIYHDYKVACTRIPVIPVGKTTFYDLWNSMLPSIGTMKPSSGLCFECQQNIASIIRSAHLSEDEKSDQSEISGIPSNPARTECGWYNQQIEDSKAESNYDEETHQPRSIHYSFDYVQQVHFPNNPQQPGPAYFLSAHKCEIFGICCDPLDSRSTTSLMRKKSSGKVLMPQLACSATIRVPMANKKTISCFMPTIALGRIRTTASSATYCTLCSWVRRSQSFYRLCFQATQSLHLTGILALSRRHTGGQGWTPWGALLAFWSSHR